MLPPIPPLPLYKNNDNTNVQWLIYFINLWNYRPFCYSKVLAKNRFDFTCSNPKVVFFNKKFLYYLFESTWSIMFIALYSGHHMSICVKCRHNQMVALNHFWLQGQYMNGESDTQLFHFLILLCIPKKQTQIFIFLPINKVPLLVNMLSLIASTRVDVIRLVKIIIFCLFPLRNSWLKKQITNLKFS